MVCHAPRKAALATAGRLGAEVFPGCTITRSGASALLVTREGEPVATIAVEPHTEREQG